MPRPNLHKAAQCGKFAFRTALQNCREPDGPTVVTALTLAIIIFDIPSASIARAAGRPVTIRRIYRWVAGREQPNQHLHDHIMRTLIQLLDNP